MKRDCKKGWNCGASCINKNKNCLQKVGLEAAAVMDKYVELFKGLKAEPSDLGKVFNKASEDELEAAYTLYQSLLDSPKANRRGVKRPELDSVEAFIEKGGIDKYEKAYNDSFENGKFNAKGTSDYIKNNVIKKEISEEFANEVYNSLPKAVKSKLNKAGDPRSGFWEGNDENGSPIIGSKATKKRGQFLIKRYLEQDGIDPYDGKKVNLNDAELEHIVPDGKGTGLADQPDNWAWISAANNKWHSDMDAKQWRANGEAKLADKEAYVKSLEEAKKGAKKQSGLLANVESELSKAFSTGSSAKERQQSIQNAATALGSKNKKLLSAAGLPESFQEFRAAKWIKDKATKNRTQAVDMRAGQVIGAYRAKYGNIKPTDLTLQALAYTASKPEQNEKLRQEFKKAMASRAIDFDKAKEIIDNEGEAAFSQALKDKDIKFGMDLKKIMDEIDGFKPV